MMGDLCREHVFVLSKLEIVFVLGKLCREIVFLDGGGGGEWGGGKCLFKSQMLLSFVSIQTSIFIAQQPGESKCGSC